MEEDLEKQYYEKMNELKEKIIAKEEEYTKIKDIQYMGNLKVKTPNGEEEVECFLVIKDVDGDIQYTYYINEEMIAIDKLQMILPTKVGLEENIDIAQIEELIDNEEAISLTQLEEKDENEKEKKVEDMAQTLELKEEDVESCTELNTEQELCFKQNTKSEINVDKKVTNTENLRDMIPELREYQKIGVVYSNTGNKFSFVGIKQNGEIAKIESLLPTEGTNTTESIIAMNRDGSQVERKQVSALTKIKGRENEGLSVRIGQYGKIEVSYVRRTDEDQYISAPIETETQRPTTKQVKMMMDKTKNTRMNEEIEKAEQLEDVYDEMSIEDISDEAELIDWEMEAQRAHMSVEGFKEEFKRVKDEYGDMSKEELLEITHEEIEEQYRGNDRRR